MFGGIPATGAIARTATTSSRRPDSGGGHRARAHPARDRAVRGPVAARIPLAALAAILVIVAWHMSEASTFVAELRTAPRSDSAVMVTTFLLTVLVDLTVALSVGMVLAAFLFMKRMAEVSSVQAISREMLDREDAAAPPETLAKWRGLVPRGVEVYDINGPFFFGAAETFTQYLHQVSAKPKAIILDLEGVPAMDSTGLRALTTIVERRRREHVAVFLVGLQEQPRDLILRSPLAELVGRDDCSAFSRTGGDEDS